MSRLDIMTPSHAQTVIDGLYRDVERRIAASPPGLCPVDLAKSFLDLCHAQTCGKCVPCRIGLGQLSELMELVLEGKATMETISVIERLAHVIVNSADCAIGRDAARLVLDGVQGFRDDYEEHILRHRCLGGMRESVPCVALCPAGVDIPGYLVLIKYGRYADAVRLIRKDNPFPSACAYICEHPCEARCRRRMIDDAINIRGLKRYAVDHAGDVPNPSNAQPTGKTVAVIGGGPGGLSAAYYLSLMGHKVTVFEQRSKLGGMLRYGIPSYRFPREILDKEIESILSTGIEVKTGITVGSDVSFDELKNKYDALYIAIGAHTDKKTGIEGENSEGVMSAVFDHYEPYKGDIPHRSVGALVSTETGEAVMYGLFYAQDRGTLFCGPNTAVYTGMIVGQNARQGDIDVNVCRQKHLTSIRNAAGAETAMKLTSMRTLTLEECLEFIDDDELLEITPKSLRMRKRVLETELRKKLAAKKRAEANS